jgi:hypothetical protein
MKLSNMLNSALVFSAKKDARYYLNGINVYFESESGEIKAIASTDGHTAQLLSVDISRESSLPNFDSVIVSNEDVKRLIAIYPDDQIENMRITDIKTHIQPVDGNYPDISRVIPSKSAGESNELIIGFNYQYLARINTAMVKLSKGIKTKLSHAKFTFLDASSATRVDTEIRDVKVLIILMSCRL